MHRRQLLITGAAAALGTPAVRAQSEGGTVTLVAPFAAGGQIDAAARKYASRMATLLQRSVVVENKPGGGGLLAAQHVLRSRMDGRTLLVTSSSFLIAPHINRNAGYDAFRDFTEVSGLYASSAVLVAGSGSKASNAAQFVAQARREPGRSSYSTNGAGTYSHLLMEKFMADAGIQLVHVPYKSAPEASQAVLQNLVEVAIDTPFSAAARARSGQLRPMLVFGAEREASMPDVPTAAEAGYPEAGKLVILTGIAAPAKTPAAALGPLVEASPVAVADASYGGELRALGMQPVTLPVAALRETMQQQDRFFAGVIDKLKLQVGS